MILWLIALPGLAGAVSFWLPWERGRRMLLILAAGLHLLLTGACWVIPPAPRLAGWLVLDGIGLLFLTIISVLFLASAVYSAGYLRREQANPSREESDGGNAPEARFIACLLAFQATMTLVAASHHFGLFWVAMEATTLASAPLIYFHRHTLSLEAVWKYLMICSVGIALALLGNFCLAVAATASRGEPVSLLLSDLVQPGRPYQIVWLKAAFIFILVGYGTKMGLAPLHTWLPDAHSESPSLVSSLLSGALLNCAFLGILRAQQVCAAGGITEFGQNLLVGFGLLSIAVAAVFIIGQNDYKRLLAYSSIEHMGILALGVGLGGVG
ncbi:MAG: proton-conducting transporter membrane subunit, partial [bacterium]